MILHWSPHSMTVGCRNGHCAFCHDKKHTGFSALALYEKDTIFQWQWMMWKCLKIIKQFLHFPLHTEFDN